MENIKGNITSAKAIIVITPSGESKSSSDGRYAMKINRNKSTLPNLLRSSLQYGFTIICRRAIIPRKKNRHVARNELIQSNDNHHSH